MPDLYREAVTTSSPTLPPRLRWVSAYERGRNPIGVESTEFIPRVAETATLGWKSQPLAVLDQKFAVVDQRPECLSQERDKLKHIGH
jgi:hypothetical protein